MYPTLTPHLAVKNADQALEFYAKAFGADENVRFVMPDGTIAHAEMKLGDTIFTLGEAMPAYQQEAPDPNGPVQVGLTWFVPDVDEAFAKAVNAGATVVTEPSDQFHGDRVGIIRCPFGHRWIIGTHMRDVSIEDQQKAFQAMFSGGGAG